MGITELLQRIGDDNVRLQNLLEGDVDVTKTKHGTKITFYTDPENLNPASALNGHDKVCLILWLPRKLVDAALKPPTSETT